jgi:hypothetical protein
MFKRNLFVAALIAAMSVSGFAVEKTIIFQEGSNGYGNTHDTYVQTGLPDNNNNYLNHREDKFWELEWDGSDAGGRNFAMFWFPDIFGDGENQIPLGSTIISAKLQTMVINDGSRGETDTVYRLTKEWDENDVTFSNYFVGVDAALATDDNSQFEDPAFVAPNPIVGANHIPQWQGGAYTLDLTPICQEWSDGEPNFGFINTVDVGGGNGFGHVSSEAQLLTREFIDELVLDPDIGPRVDDFLKDPAFPGFDVNVSPTLVVVTAAGETYEFQHGENGYEGYQDATLSGAGSVNLSDPDDGVNTLYNYPLGLEGHIRMNTNNSSGESEFGLIRYADLFGDGANQIPYGTEIATATIKFFVLDTGPEISVYEIKPYSGTSFSYPDVEVNTDWNEETVTYASFIADGFFVQFGQEVTEDGTVGTFDASNRFAFAEADVTITLNKYSNQEIENLGWFLENTGGDDVHFIGKEGAAVFGAPALIVTYDDGASAVEDFMVY